MNARMIKMLVGLVTLVSLTSCVSLREDAWDGIAEAGSQLGHEIAEFSREVHYEFIHTKPIYSIRKGWHDLTNGCERRIDECYPICVIVEDQSRYEAIAGDRNFETQWKHFQDMELYEPVRTGIEILDTLNGEVSLISKQLINEVIKPYINMSLSGEINLYHQYKQNVKNYTNKGVDYEHACKRVWEDWRKESNGEENCRKLKAALPTIKKSEFFSQVKGIVNKNIELLKPKLEKAFSQALNNEFKSYLKSETRINRKENRDAFYQGCEETLKVVSELIEACNFIIELHNISTDEDKAIMDLFATFESTNI